ncbi:GNAT family N-acetyltransferase [Phenylobacterium montanum]|uniref:GNAT family N-acetyltransferase n=1 Tax=Phenylobacterium montanum TaxID=2823693 RepID=A0A975FWT0_9CAUL|nr:GNAT family N-acetyltransferase [Caulobacter sp. S6]QUD86258.1 GNAT family N-acetyltransferase [Caulobacter sp. S6]
MILESLPPSRLAPDEAARWRALVAADPALQSPFLTPDWALAVQRAQGGERSGVRVLRIEGPDGARGYFSARRRGPVAMPAGAPMCDYQGLAIEPGLEVTAREILSALKVDRLDFSHMLADQPAFAPYLRGDDISHGVDLSAGHAAYLAERRRATGLFKDLDKRRRKAERELGPVRFEAFCRSAAAFDKLIAWKRELMSATGQTDLFDAGWPLRLLSDLLQSRDPAFGGVLFTLSLGDRLAAAHLHLRGGRTIHAWIIGHDRELDRYSPGLLLFQDILAWMDGDYAYLDFGPGDYRFKHQFANAGRAVGHGFVGRPSPAMIVRAAQYQVRAVAERLELGEVSALPGKAMRRLDMWRGLK